MYAVLSAISTALVEEAKAVSGEKGGELIVDIILLLELEAPPH